MKKITALILLFCFVCYTYSAKQECSSPVECYIKANRELDSERDELRNLRNKLENIVQNKGKIIEEKITQIVNDIQKKIDDRVNDKVEEINSQSQANFQNNVDQVKKNFTDKFKSLALEYNNKLSEIKKYQANPSNSAVAPSNVGNIRQYMYKDAIIFHDIIDSLNKGIIKRVGNPRGNDENSFRINPWQQRKLLSLGNTVQSDGDGYTVSMPEGYNVLWLRLSNHVWFTLKVTYADGDKEFMGKFSGGRRYLNEISPQGDAPDSYRLNHMWINIPVTRSGLLLLQSDVNSESAWISGLAYGKNLWNHARNSAVAYHWKINGGNNVEWVGDNWKGDQLAYIKGNSIVQMKVPVHPSGLDKLLYIVEYNQEWVGTMHSSIIVNGTQIERFRTTYDNAFARHFNSKAASRYIAARIPASLIDPKKRFLDVQIDMTSTNPGININFRECGTHDY